MSTPVTIHFCRWTRNPWPECGIARGMTVGPGRTDAVTCKRCRATSRFKEAAAKPIPNTSWRAGAKALTGKEPIGGTFTVTVGKAKKTFRHTQVKTAHRWLDQQLEKQISKFIDERLPVLVAKELIGDGMRKTRKALSVLGFWL